MLKTAAQRGLLDAHEHVVVRAHQRVGDAAPGAPEELSLEQLEKRRTVLLVAEELAPGNGLGIDVLRAPRDLDTGRISHLDPGCAGRARRRKRCHRLGAKLARS